MNMKLKIILWVILVIFLIFISIFFLSKKFNSETNTFLSSSDILKTAESFIKKGDEFDRVKDKKAIVNYEKSLKLYLILKDYERISYCYNSIGICYRRLEDYNKSFDNYKKALYYADFIKDKKVKLRRKASIFYNLASLFELFNFYKKSLEFYKLSSYCFQKLGRKDDYYETRGDIGIVYRRMGNINKAIEETFSAYNYFLKQKNWYQIALYANNIGYFYLKKGDIKNAEIFHKRALNIALKYNFGDLFPYIYNGLGEIYFKKHDFKKSLKYQKLAEKTSDGDNIDRFIFKDMAQLYLAMGDKEKAAYYLEKYNKLLKRLFNPKIFEKFESLLSFIEKEKHKQELLVVEKEKEIERLMKNLFIVGFILTLMVLGFLFYRYRVKQKMNRYLELLAKKDPLTGLSNRRDVMEKLEEEVLRFERLRTTFSIAIGDIDDFKHINDTYGHAAGDMVLREIADIFLASLRNMDRVARWGGEEFLIFLPNTSEDNAFGVLEKLRKKIEERVFKYKDKEFKITMTFGLCTFKEGISLNECIDMADKALYEGKNSGKNRVVVYGKN